MSQLTKKAIKKSFMKLLNDRPLDKITVKDIVEDCEINRNTFYYYYQDIYALVEEIFLDETKEAIEKDIKDLSWQDGVMRAIDFALLNKKAIFHVYNSRSRKELERYLSQTIGKAVTEYIRIQAEGLHASERDIRLVSSFYSQAIKGLLLEWVDQGMKEDPVANLGRLGELFDGNVRMILERASGEETSKA